MKLNPNSLFVVLALSIAASEGFAQGNYLFKVLATSGKPEVKKSDTWTPLKSGASLAEQDEVRVGTKTYVGLIHTNGKARELMKPGTYKIKDLAMTMTGGSTVLNKYFDFILSKNTDEAKQNRLVAVGSVTRETFRDDILINLPENKHAEILNNQVILRWDSKSEASGPFIVMIQNLSDEFLFSLETPGPMAVLDLTKPELAKESFFLVSVQNKRVKTLASTQYLVKRLPANDQKKFKEQVDALHAQMPEISAMNKLVLAGFYEENFLLIDAVVAYEEAIQLAPEVDFYREAFEEFQLRNGLKFPKK